MASGMHDISIALVSSDSLWLQAMEHLLRQAGVRHLSVGLGGAETLHLLDGRQVSECSVPHIRIGGVPPCVPVPLMVSDLWQAIESIQQVPAEEIMVLTDKSRIHRLQKRLCGPLGEATVTGKEIALLEQLMQAGGTMSREALLRSVWGYDSGKIETTTLETHLYRLRRKIKETGCNLTVQLADGVVFLMPLA